MENKKIKKQLIEAYEKSIDAMFDDNTHLASQTSQSDITAIKSMLYSDDWVFILVDIFAAKISAQELKVMKREFNGDGKASYNSDDRHYLNDKIYNANEEQTYHELMYAIVADFVLTGNAVIYRTPTDELVHIPIEMIQLDVDHRGAKTYRVISNDDLNASLSRTIMTLENDKLVHIKTSNPSSAVWGLSPFVPGRKAVLFNRYSTEYLTNFYVKGAQPGLVLTMSGVGAAKQEMALRMLRSLELAHSGRRNQRRNMILPDGVKAESMAHTLADQQLKDYIELNRETIINLLKVPKHELSIATSGSLGSEEHRVALRNFWQGPLRSKMKSLEAGLSKLYRRELGKDRHLEFDLSNIEFLQDDLDNKAMIAEKLLKTHTLNEVRSLMFSLDPLDGGDTTPGVVPETNDFFQYSAKEEDAIIRPESNNSDRNIVSDDAIHLDYIDPVQLAKDENLRALSKVITEKDDWFIRREEAMVAGDDERSKLIEDNAMAILAEQVDAVLKLVKTGLKSHSRAKVKALDAKLRRDISKALNSFEPLWIESNNAVIATKIDTAYDAQLIVPFNIPDEDKQEVLRQKRIAASKRQASDRLASTFSNINKTTEQRIFKILEDGVTASKTIDEMALEIGEKINDQRRANTIARTELAAAGAIGLSAAMDDAEEIVGDIVKVWINAGDERVRGNPLGEYPDAQADHWSIGGEVVKQAAKFSNGLRYPSDDLGPVAETINCRCVVVFFPKDEADNVGLTEIQSTFEAEQQ